VNGVPTGVLTWTATLPAPGATWLRTIVVTPLAGYGGPLVNLVAIWSSEGATATSAAIGSVTVYRAYLPLVWRDPAGP
jgi:hypothetical protein